MTNNTIDSENQGGVPESESSKALRLEEFFYLCIEHWRWFVISVLVCLAIACIYIYRSTPVYERSTSLLIKTDSEGRSASTSAAMFEDLGITQGNLPLYDEIQILKSPNLMKDVVRKLGLDVSYTSTKGFRKIHLYGKKLPVQVNFKDLQEDEFGSFKLELNGNGEFTISKMVLGKDKLNHAPIKGHMGVPVKTQLGIVEITAGPAFSPDENYTINVRKMKVKKVASDLLKKLVTEMDDDCNSHVTLTLQDWSAPRAEDVLNTIVSCYEATWMADKQKQADNSSKFIDERVKVLQNELGNVENDISSFKSSNLIPDVGAAATIYMNQASQSAVTINELRNQEYMAKYIRNYLSKSENNHKPLPTNTGLDNTTVATQIGLYNTKVLERNSLVAQSSASNPLAVELDAELSAMRGALLASMENEILSLKEQIKSQEGLSNTANSKIASNPKQEKYLLSVERQQKVKENLYLYLLQKREENQLNQSFTSSNTKVISDVDGLDTPIKPAKAQILLIAFLAGLFFPGLLIYYREMNVHVVRGRKDIKDMKIPLAGELPLYGKKQKLPRNSFTTNSHPHPIVAVKHNNRNPINEAFRVLRTNLEFMIGQKDGHEVIMVISANPGSGKTFVTYNLAKSLAIKGKKVAVVDLDMRKGALSSYMDSKSPGVSDYLASRTDNIPSLEHSVEGTPTMTLIPAGTTPPNPTELLVNGRLENLIEYLKAHYDYVFLDCPPAEVVADASIIGKYVDYTLFVIRAGLFDLSMLPVIDEMYEKNKFPHMSLILNGTIMASSSYGRRNANSYNYGYGYGSYTNED